MTAPVAIEVRDLAKTFRIPLARVDSLKERVTQPLAARETRELRALRDVSFDVHRGEFFGIVGRNGSGKSTLLKILASIYGADAGRVRVAGTMAPFIELGVGFNPELAARENVVLNGVLMGLSRREAERRLDAVLDFADLREFADLKLKNYSSGMMVRLAFAVMVQADADVMLIDEVLAVGDAAFARKCMDVFHERHRAGRTIVLVTHDMVAVRDLCDRAMLLHGGELGHIGGPEETALRYFAVNEIGGTGRDGVGDFHADLLEAAIVDAAGEPVEALAQGRPIDVRASFAARRDLHEPVFGLQVLDANGTPVFAADQTQSGSGPALVGTGERVDVRARLDNPLLPGRYTLNCSVFRREGERGALQLFRLAEFTVEGERAPFGMVHVGAHVEATLAGRAR